MIINSYIITYLVCSALSLALGLVASINGFYIWRKWDLGNSAEEQYRLEKRVYLIVTIVSLGFFLRLLMIPLWFWTLQSMIVSIPGAMCLIGVHNVNAPYSYVTSGLKPVLATLYGYWLILNYFDRQTPAQPFMKQKLMFLAPLGIMIIIETILDASFFFSTPPRQVSCCTSLFDIPRDDIPQIITESTWTWVFIFYVLALFVLGELFYFLFINKSEDLTKKTMWFGKKSFMIFETFIIISLFTFLVLAIHTKISPLFLELPFHHCIFCLLQDVWDALLSFSLVYIGLALLMIYFWITSSANYLDVESTIREKVVKLLVRSSVMIISGLIILSIHFLYVIIAHK
ncbi:MAG: hypothetical protein SVZ03_00505 [Spirochaetota bacterium]|nr:hypothetical protein [Spirochaetota bacterium]